MSLVFSFLEPSSFDCLVSVDFATRPQSKALLCYVAICSALKDILVCLSFRCIFWRSEKSILSWIIERTQRWSSNASLNDRLVTYSSKRALRGDAPYQPQLQSLQAQ